MKTLILAAIRCSLMFTAVVGFSLACPAKANLITNGGFETGDFTGWTVSGPAGVVGVDFVPPHSGAFQAASFVNTVMLIQNVTTTTGASYVVDFWLAAGHGFAVFSILWGGSVIFTQDFFDESFDYTEHKFALTASSATTELEFRSSILDGVILLDDVSVTPVGVPDTGSTVSLLGSALLGLATLRRKLS